MAVTILLREPHLVDGVSVTQMSIERGVSFAIKGDVVEIYDGMTAGAGRALGFFLMSEVLGLRVDDSPGAIRASASMATSAGSPADLSAAGARANEDAVATPLAGLGGAAAARTERHASS